jgi:hypothetical protein
MTRAGARVWEVSSGLLQKFRREQNPTSGAGSATHFARLNGTSETRALPELSLSASGFRLPGFGQSPDGAVADFLAR